MYHTVLNTALWNIYCVTKIYFKGEFSFNSILCSEILMTNLKMCALNAMCTFQRWYRVVHLVPPKTRILRHKTKNAREDNGQFRWVRILRGELKITSIWLNFKIRPEVAGGGRWLYIDQEQTSSVQEAFHINLDDFSIWNFRPDSWVGHLKSLQRTLTVKSLCYWL